MATLLCPTHSNSHTHSHTLTLSLFSDLTVYCVVFAELGGHFEDAVVAFMMPPHEYDATCLREAMAV